MCRRKGSSWHYRLSFYMNALHDFVPILSLFLSWEWNPPTHSSYSAMRIWNYRWEKRSERDARKAVLMANMLFEIKEIYKHLFSSFFFCFFFKCVHVFYNVLIISFPRLDKAQSSEIGVCIACNYPILKMRFPPPIKQGSNIQGLRSAFEKMHGYALTVEITDWSGPGEILTLRLSVAEAEIKAVVVN